MRIGTGGDKIRPMTIKVLIRANDQVLRTFTFTHTTNVPVPNVGETVMHPKSENVPLRVDQRRFEYGTDRLKITLYCSGLA